MKWIVCRLRLAGLAGLACAAPLMADVKAGADAWSRGDFPAAIREWQGPAEAGDPDAQFNMAQAYRLGRGVPRDLVRAEALFGKAAAQGHVQAADNYGLLMFDRGDRMAAMPYVRAAAERGDPRAQYLLGIAHFNGDLAAKDWKRAYALMTLAQGAGLAQAKAALAQMDQFIPLADRQSAAALAAQMAAKAEAQRAAQLASADLGGALAARPAPVRAAPRASAPPRPEAALAAAERTAANASPATAGADYARPAAATLPTRPVPAAPPAAVAGPTKPAPRPAPTLAAAAPAKPPAAPKPAPVKAAIAKPAPVGNWRVQLGAFAVAANADALWNKLRGRPELAGHPRINARAGKAVKLQAGGFASREAANAACASLARAGQSCLPAQD